MARKKSGQGYVDVNGLNMYYEIHGDGQPLVLLHGAFSAVGTSFGALIPLLAKQRQVIAFELQAHGRTADIDRPLSIEAMAGDTAAAIQKLGLDSVDLLGYSMGGSVALHSALRYPNLIRKLILMSVSFTLGGVRPGLMDGLGEMKAEMMHGSPWHDEYIKIAPHPEHFATLFEKKTAMDRQIQDIPAESIQGLKMPALLIIGDSDLIRIEHAAEFLRLVGGDVFGDMPPGLPNSQLAVLPGTSHVSIVGRTELLTPIINSFLDKPLPETQP